MRTIAAMLGRILKWSVIVLAVLSVVLLVGGFFAFRAVVEPDSAKFDAIPDEAKEAKRTRESLSAEAVPYFAQMDKGLLVKPADGAAYPKEILEIAALTKLTAEQVRESAIRGQNAWIVWTGGNDRFWDFASRNTAGAFDLLKTVSSYKGEAGYKAEAGYKGEAGYKAATGGMSYGRHNRWSWLGLNNEPCFTEAKGPDEARFGLWLDQRDPNCPPDPFADPAKYPGVEIRARGKTVPVGSYYGEP